MTAPASDLLSSSFARQPLPGCWTLAAGRAISLRPREAGELRIASGRVWATFDGPHPRFDDDLFLEAGASLRLAPGQRVVIEPYGLAGAQPVAFSWQPVPLVRAASGAASLAQPASDLRLALRGAGSALGAAAGALARLGAGALALVAAGVLRRGRRLPAARALRADSSASRAQGAMPCGDSIASSGAL
jgi:Protein of unknown function (DUF2917)